MKMLLLMNQRQNFLVFIEANYVVISNSNKGQSNYMKRSYSHSTVKYMLDS